MDMLEALAGSASRSEVEASDGEEDRRAGSSSLQCSIRRAGLRLQRRTVCARSGSLGFSRRDLEPVQGGSNRNRRRNLKEKTWNRFCISPVSIRFSPSALPGASGLSAGARKSTRLNSSPSCANRLPYY